MNKLGDAWVDMAAVSAVVPMREKEGYALFLNSGRIVGLPEVSEEDVVALLQHCGLIDESEMTEVALTEDELEELLLAMKAGYHFAAKDITGQVYAYTQPPVKCANGWNPAETPDSKVRRLRQEYDALSADHRNPLVIDALFEVDDE